MLERDHAWNLIMAHFEFVALNIVFAIIEAILAECGGVIVAIGCDFIVGVANHMHTVGVQYVKIRRRKVERPGKGERDTEPQSTKHRGGQGKAAADHHALRI